MRSGVRPQRRRVELIILPTEEAMEHLNQQPRKDQRHSPCNLLSDLSRGIIISR